MTPKRGVAVLGIGGNVVMIEMATGREVWRQALKGGQLVTVLWQGDLLLAGNHGHLYRLDPATGRILWMNDLPKLGFGPVHIAFDGESSSTMQALAAQVMQQQEQDAAASSSVST